MKTLIVAGKGGAGKTTATSMLVHRLLQNRPDQKVLVLDGDPAANLALNLEISVMPEMPIGELKVFLPENESANMDHELLKNFREHCLVTTTLEEMNFDFGYLGHHTDHSCLCAYNNALNRLLKLLKQDNAYDIVILDREAGLEHINRSVYGSKEDALLVVTWPSPEYFGVAKDIFELADILGTTDNRALLVNNVPGLEVSEADFKDILQEIGAENVPLYLLPKLQLYTGLKKNKLSKVIVSDAKATEVIDALLVKIL